MCRPDHFDSCTLCLPSFNSVGVKLKKIDTAYLSLDAFKTAWLRVCDLETELTKRGLKVTHSTHISSTS